MMVVDIKFNSILAEEPQSVALNDKRYVKSEKDELKVAHVRSD